MMMFATLRCFSKINKNNSVCVCVCVYVKGIFPGGPVVKNPFFHCRGQVFHP